MYYNWRGKPAVSRASTSAVPETVPPENGQMEDRGPPRDSHEVGAAETRCGGRPADGSVGHARFLPWLRSGGGVNLWYQWLMSCGRELEAPTRRKCYIIGRAVGKWPGAAIK
jgi:hypothetical protein